MPLPPLSAQSSNSQGQNQTPDMEKFPVIIQLSSGKLTGLDLLSWKKQYFVPSEIDIYTEYGFAFPAHNISAQTTIHRVSHFHDIPHDTASDLGIHFTPKGVWQWANALGISGLAMFLTILKQVTW